MSINKWYLANSNTKFDLIELLLCPQCSNDFRIDALEHHIICDGFGETVVWALVEFHEFNKPYTMIEQPKNFYIQYYMIKNFDGAWHYQSGSEVNFPNHYNCPLSFLEKANHEVNNEWREKVRQFHHTTKTF